MSVFSHGDILECINDDNVDFIKKGCKYTFERYNDTSRVILKEAPLFKYYSERFIKVTKDSNMDTIQLTYAEAWEKLKEGKEVFYNNLICRLNKVDKNILYTDEYGRYAPFHPTDKIFTMKKEPEYEILGLHDDLVEIEVFGVTTYLKKGSKAIYSLASDGCIFDDLDEYLFGRVKFKGNHKKAKVSVYVDYDGIVTKAYPHD